MVSRHTLPIVMYVLIALAVVFALAAVAMIVYVVYHYVCKGVFAPVRKVRARVLRKGQREYEVDAPKYWAGDSLGTLLWVRVMAALGRETTFTVYRSLDYYAVFLADGEEREFMVSEETFANLHEGDEGILAYKGNLFRYFLPTVARAPQPRSRYV